MNDQSDNPDMVERTDKDMNSPEVNPEPLTNKVPVDADLIHEASTGETEIHETPMEETVVNETPMGETITHETPHSTNAGASASLLLTMKNQSNFAPAGMRYRESLWMNHALLLNKRMNW